MNKSRTYRFGESALTLIFGDLVTSEAQVIVSSDDHFLTMGGGVSAAIRRAGGIAIPLDAAKRVPAALGSVVATTAGSLPAQYVFHAITIGPNPNGLDAAGVVAEATRRCMQLLKLLQLRSIAFPAIGAGVAGFSYEEVASRMADVIVSEMVDCAEPLNVAIYLLDRFGEMSEIDFIAFFEEFTRRCPAISRQTTSPSQPPPDPSASIRDLISQAEEELQRSRVHKLRRLLGELEEERGRLEERLLTATRNGAESEQALRASLAQNEELRLVYRGELRDIAEGISKVATAGAAPRTAFLSSTYLDLKEHRLAIKDAVIKRKLFFSGMEIFGAHPDRARPAAKIVQEVRDADIYIGVFGVRYGSVDPATGLSMTELEFKEAEATQRKMLLYMMHPDASVPVSHLEKSPEALKKLEDLKAYIRANHLVYEFRTVEELAGQVYIDLGKA